MSVLSWRGCPIFLGSILTVLVLAACNQSQSNAPTGQMPSGPSPQAVEPPPPQPQRLELYMVPLNPNDFSMPAIQANKTAIEKNPNDVKALVSLAHANFMIQRIDKAQDYYERALKADQNNTEARLSLANCYVLMREYDKAVKQLDALLKSQKDYPEALYNKGLILLRAKGDRKGAKQAWAQLVETQTDHPLAVQVKSELERL